MSQHLDNLRFINHLASYGRKGFRGEFFKQDSGGRTIRLAVGTSGCQVYRKNRAGEFMLLSNGPSEGLQSDFRALIETAMKAAHKALGTLTPDSITVAGRAGELPFIGSNGKKSYGRTAR